MDGFDPVRIRDSDDRAFFDGRMLIKHLLRSEGNTVDGARRKLAAIASNGQLEMAFREVSLKEVLEDMKTGLREVIELLA